MAIMANRYWTLLLLLTGAAASYVAGFMAGFWLLIAVGFVLELFLWRQLLKRRR